MIFYVRASNVYVWWIQFMCVPAMFMCDRFSLCALLPCLCAIDSVYVRPCHAYVRLIQFMCGPAMFMCG